ALRQNAEALHASVTNRHHAKRRAVPIRRRAPLRYDECVLSVWKQLGPSVRVLRIRLSNPLQLRIACAARPERPRSIDQKSIVIAPTRKGIDGVGDDLLRATVDGKFFQSTANGEHQPSSVRGKRRRLRRIGSTHDLDGLIRETTHVERGL